MPFRYNPFTGTLQFVNEVGVITEVDPTALKIANNLGDLANAGSGRGNLGLGTAAILNAGLVANNLVQLDGSGDLPAVGRGGVTGFGTSAALDVGVGVNQVVQLDGSSKLPAVDASLLTNLPDNPAVSNINSNIMLNALRISANNSIAIEEMIDGFVDSYQNETGINVGASSGQTFNSGGKLYENLGSDTDILTQSSGGNDSQFGDTGGFQKTGMTFTAPDTGLLTGVTVYIGKTNSPTDNVLLSIQTVDGNDRPTGTILGTQESIDGSTLTGLVAAIRFDFATAPSLTNAVKYAIVLERSGGLSGTNLYKMDVITSDVIAGGRLGFDGSVWAGPTTTVDMKFILHRVTVAPILVLQSLFVNALVQPTEAKILFIVENGTDTIVLSDLGATVSRDDAVTNGSVILSEEGDFSATQKLYGGVIDISGQPSGIRMVYRLNINNNKSGKIHGASLLWS